MPRKPLAQHALNGTTPEYEYQREVVSHIPMSKPTCPPHIKADAGMRHDWAELVRDLKSRGTLTRSDGRLMAQYCEKAKQRREALTHLDAEGLVCSYTRLDSNGQAHTFEKKNMYWSIEQDCLRVMTAILDRLGLHPINKDKPRRGVAPKQKPAPVQEAPPIEVPEWLKQKLQEEKPIEEETNDGNSTDNSEE